MDERRGDAGEQVLEGQALAQGVEGVAPVLGVAQHDGPVADGVEGGPGVDEQQDLAPVVVGVAHEHAVADLVVAVARASLASRSSAVVGMQEVDEVVAEQRPSWSKPRSTADRRADVADGAVGGDREHDVADLRQRLVELHPA